MRLRLPIDCQRSPSYKAFVPEGLKYLTQSCLSWDLMWPLCSTSIVLFHLPGSEHLFFLPSSSGTCPRSPSQSPCTCLSFLSYSCSKSFPNYLSFHPSHEWHLPPRHPHVPRVAFWPAPTCSTAGSPKPLGWASFCSVCSCKLPSITG